MARAAGLAARKPSLAASPSALLVAAAVAAGLALRAWVLASPLGGLDADEAVWGLMARHALDGELAVFFWGQSYGGTHEVALTAPLFWIFGSGTVVLRLVPLALFALAAVLVWRVGRRTVGEPAASLGAALFWVWPAYVVWKSSRAHGFYAASLVLALALVLLALRLRDRDSPVEMALLGLVGGLGWWASPQFAYVALPTLVWLVARRPRLLRSGWIALAGALAGAAPWIVWNASHGWRSLTTPFGPGQDTYVDHLRTFFYATLPQALGLRVPFSLEWLTGALVGRALEALAVAAVGYLAVRRGRCEVLVTIAIAYPFLQSLSPFSSLNTEPRYLVLLAPVAALLVAKPLALHPLLATAGIAACVILSVVGLREMGEHRLPVPPVGGQRTPADLEPVLRALERAGVQRARAPYAIAYRIDFESGERIIADSTGQVRYEPYRRLLQRRRRPAYVFVSRSPAERASAGRLLAEDYRRILAGNWAVYVPRRAS